MEKSALNLKTVAARVGVSTSTVSRTLSGKGYVNEKTREKVLKAVKELNYTPNTLAKSLKMGRTNTIALMIPSIENEIFPIITRGIEDTARENGFTVVLCNTYEDVNVEKDYIDKLRTRWIDGFIVCSMLPGSDHIRQLKADGFPLVLISRYYDESIDAIVIDNYQASYDAVSFLVKRGCRKIAIALGRIELSIYQKRFQGYKDALKDHGIEINEKLILNETNGTKSFYELTFDLLKSGVTPDAIFATSDPKAIVVMRAVKDFGLRIPDDVQILGFDNIEISSMIDPPLSTVSQPLHEMGVQAANKIISMIMNKGKKDFDSKPGIDVFSTELVIRKSTK